ncbi:MAG: hypothetical protein R3C53_20735 [Pirellulaceae bacterium]
MISKPSWAITVLLGSTLMMSVGCEQATQATVIQNDNIEGLPPAQIQLALRQLSASDARQQQSGLEFAEQFPSLVQTHRELIAKLADAGASAAVKKKASQLLHSSEADSANNIEEIEE